MCGPYYSRRLTSERDRAREQLYAMQLLEGMLRASIDCAAELLERGDVDGARQALALPGIRGEDLEDTVERVRANLLMLRARPHPFD